MPGQPEEETVLLKHAQRGEADAFGVLYERHAVIIFRYLYAHLSDRAEAEDMTSDVFLRAWQSLPKYDQRGVPFRAYLFRIAHNTLVDYYRHSRNRQRPIEEEDGSTPGGDVNPLDSLEEKSNRLELAGYLESLKDDYRTVLVLRFLTQLSPTETAVVMKRSSGAVRVLQHRALEALRHLIQQKKAGNHEG